MYKHDYTNCPYAIFKHTGAPICVMHTDFCEKVEVCEREIEEVPKKQEVDIGWK